MAPSYVCFRENCQLSPLFIILVHFKLFFLHRGIFRLYLPNGIPHCCFIIASSSMDIKQHNAVRGLLLAAATSPSYKWEAVAFTEIRPKQGSNTWGYPQEREDGIKKKEIQYFISFGTMSHLVMKIVIDVDFSVWKRTKNAQKLTLKTTLQAALHS